LINTIPLTEVSPLNFKEESAEAAENLAGTIMQEAAESFFACSIAGVLFWLLQENNNKAINKTK
jgi:hypothetical protein